MPSEDYKKAGVNVRKITPFKQLMGEVSRNTAAFALARGVRIRKIVRPHGGVFEHINKGHYVACVTHEGPGNLGYIADFVYENDPQGPSYADVTAYSSVMMAANDCVAQGVPPAVCTDLVAASSDDWFADENRAHAFARGMYEACRDVRMALVAGESAVDRYIVNPRAPVRCTAEVSVSVHGYAQSHHLITGERLEYGNVIIGVSSRNQHANGSSIILQRVVGDKEKGFPGLPNGFDTTLPSGTKLKDAILMGTRCYVPFVERLVQHVNVHAIMPSTGDGVAKLSLAGPSDIPYEYKIDEWPPIPELFLGFEELLGIERAEGLKIFNYGIGIYIIVSKRDVIRTLDVIRMEGLDGFFLGYVIKGERRGVRFGPANDLWLDPPDE